ncbi:3-ketoacyl-CoA synthase 19-like, partial [Bidens hawaiensis]|uniref:3-ketoacyl-CoA synthase 19-like n=1 Tax=Bidens hawaiensis TaxID=980011 RepID=UPI00404B98F9
VPSLTSRIINHYNMREDIQAFNFTGMGCRTSQVAIDLVQYLFKIQKNRLAIVVSTESMAGDWYCGRERSMMLSNCIFRIGGCSILLTNDKARKNQAMLKLKCLVRTHLGSDDEAYNCCMQLEDNVGYEGFHLSKLLPKVAARALTKNLQVLLPKVLPFWEIIRYAMQKNRSKINLKTGIEHVCIHPGGRAVIDKVGTSLGLNEYDLEPARMALHRFGNTSSGGLWYVLGYMEAKKRLKKDDRILMISLGAGFKSNNCVWEVTRDMDRPNVWKDIIESYPPETAINPFLEKFGWINDEALDFVRPEDVLHMMGMV